FRGVAFLIAPNGYPVGVGTKSDFTWLGSGRLFQSDAFVGIPVILVILIVVAVLGHVAMKYTDLGRSIYALGGNATAARLAGINLGVLSNGMNLVGVQQYFQDVATGMLLILSVAIAQWRAGRAERARTRVASVA